MQQPSAGMSDDGCCNSLVKDCTEASASSVSGNLPRFVNPEPEDPGGGEGLGHHKGFSPSHFFASVILDARTRNLPVENTHEMC